MHFEDADLVSRAEAILHGAQDAKLVSALTLEIEDGIDHVLDHARTGNIALLGDVPDEHQRGAGFLGPASQFLRAGPDLADRAGRGLKTVRPHGLDGIDHHEIRFGRFQRRKDLSKVGFGGEVDRAFGNLQSLGALLDLRGSFLARHIDRFHAIAGEPRGNLQQQGRFADTGVAADQGGG